MFWRVAAEGWRLALQEQVKSYLIENGQNFNLEMKLQK